MRLADYVIDRLRQEGTTNFYLVTGRGSIFLSDALARRTDVRAVAMHNEQSVGYAAVADSIATGGLGACIVSTGCGSTNAISGVLCAWQDQIPTVFISGQHLLHETTHHNPSTMRTYGEQESDIVALVSPITKYAVMVQKASDIKTIMDTAIRESLSGRPGPVWIDIPLDLQSAQINPEASEPDPVAPEDTVDDFREVFADINAATRPVLLLGSSSSRATLREKVIAFAEKFDLPIVYDASAVDVVPWSHPLHVGSVGAMGCSRAGAMSLQNSDVLIALGSHMRSTVTGEDPSSFAREARIIRVDVDGTQVRRDRISLYREIDVPVEKFLDIALKIDESMTHKAWVKKCRHWKTSLPGLVRSTPESNIIDLYDLAEVLGDTMPENGILVTDSGLTELIVPTNVHFGPNHSSVHPYSQGAMGFALPAAVGASVATQRPVVAAIGDGSVMMNLQELEVIRHHNLNIKVIITNNDAYAVIRKRQKDLFRGRTIGTDPSNGVSCPDYSRIAGAFGLQYASIRHKDDLVTTLRRELRAVEPAIIEVFTDQEQEYVRTSRATLSSRKSVIRPLEDQFPFLNRELLRNEMVIEPLNLE